MEIKLKTQLLQDLVNKSVKGMGANKMLPITEMIGININGPRISLLSTDGSNKVEVIGTIEGNSESIQVAVAGKTFANLVQKTTTENVTLVFEDNKLTVKGNGTYTFPLSIDEDDDLVKMSSIDIEGLETKEVLSKDLKQSYDINKESVALTMETPAFSGFYYDKDGAITTNSLKVSYVKNSLFNNPVLLFKSFAALFELIEEETVKVAENNSSVFVITPTLIMKGQKKTEILEFPTDQIKALLNTEITHQVRVNKQALLNLLERIALFITPYDKNNIRIDFTKDGMRVWTIDGNSNELLPYISSEDPIENTMKVDITSFKALVSSNPDEELLIHYGHSDIVKMTFGMTVQALALSAN